ncbi:MAG: GrpB family protein [Bacteroidales bacterium]|nr:GrpB family protein [Bacteroidales bacterium]
MAKLSEMTLEELWQLFPIFLTEHKSYWYEWYIQEKDILNDILKNYNNYKIHHIGSTAISNIWAKPIIDILIEFDIDTDLVMISNIFVKNGYICMSKSNNRISLNKGYTEQGFAEKVFHIHLRYQGDNNEIFFRDYLNKNQDIAKEYETLKLSLWHKFEHNRDGYTQAKTDFIEKITKFAKDDFLQ